MLANNMTAIVLRINALVDSLVDMQIKRLARKYQRVVDAQMYLLEQQAEGFDSITEACDESIERATQHAYNLRQALAEDTAQQVEALQAKRVALWRARRDLGGE